VGKKDFNVIELCEIKNRIQENLSGLNTMKTNQKEIVQEAIPNDLNEKLVSFFLSKFKQYGVCNLGLLKTTFAKEYGLKNNNNFKDI
jgi:hypothetical protein